MKTDWKLVVALPICFWIGHALQIAYQDQQALTDKNSRLTSAILQQVQDCKDKTAGVAKACSESLVSLKEQNAGEASRAQTLEEQVRSERTTIDNFSREIIKATVQQRTITPVVLDFDNSNVAAKKSRWILLTNKDMGEMHLIIGCDQAIEITDHVVLNGDNTIGHQPMRMTAYMWDITLSSRWTPVTPILIGVRHSGPDAILCSFGPR